MRKLLVPFAMLCVTGCVSDQEVAQRAAQQAAIQRAEEQAILSCNKPRATRLAVAQCKNAVLLRRPDISPRDRDLFQLAMAIDENVAARQDRHELTDDQAKLERAVALSRLTSETQKRDAAVMQRLTEIANSQALVAAANRPAVVVNNQVTTSRRGGFCVNTGDGMSCN